MKTHISDLSPTAYARIAGILYLIITVAAIVAHFYVPAELLVPGDAAATAENILASETLFRWGAVGGELVILLSEIILSVMLYYLLKPVNQTLSMIAAVSRLAMTAVHGLNLLNYYFVLELLKNDQLQTLFAPEQLQGLAGLFLEAHSIGFVLGIAFLVPHMFSMGILIYQSGYFPKALGILFLIAGVGYLIDTVGLLLLPDYQTTPTLIAMSIAVAEIAFPIWLLVKGVDMEHWQNRTVAMGAA